MTETATHQSSNSSTEEIRQSLTTSISVLEAPVSSFPGSESLEPLSRTISESLEDAEKYYMIVSGEEGSGNEFSDLLEGSAGEISDVVDAKGPRQGLKSDYNINTIWENNRYVVPLILTSAVHP